MVLKRRLRYLAASAVVAGCTAGVIGCGGSPSGPSGSGTLNMMLKDSPFKDAKAVLVTFTEVSVHKDTDADFTKLTFAGGAASRTCDLTKLQTAQDVLGVGTLTAGHYTQVRLLVSEAKLYFDNPSQGDACSASIAAPPGGSALLTIPSGEVKLNRQFEVPEAGSVSMLLDFDGDGSITQTGSNTYIMRPVITIVGVN
jgi:Domain of unknown function (DUF4382)